MPGRSRWKTVIDGVEKSHRSERATYDFLVDWAETQPDGAKSTVYVQDDRSGGRWQTFERHVVINGLLDTD